MLLVDDRTGSKHLAEPLRTMGLAVELTRLDFGDVAFEGKGVGGGLPLIGIELKRLQDLVSSIRTGRLSGHQLPGLHTTYEYRWLVVEGMWRTNTYGQVVLSHGRSRGWLPVPGGMTGSELEKHLLTYELCGGLHVRLTNRPDDTIRFIAMLYRWWTDKAFDQHTSHLDAHKPGGVVPLSDFRQAVMAWPGVGRAASLSAEARFKAVRRAANGTVDEWASLTTTDSKGKTRRFGIPAAEHLVSWLRGDRV